ncbi:hypothetical protein SAMN04488136_11633 [Vibrio xiamenensis]|uniref:Uncharacterized protein n=1 Tax=Vibrio xiamenensis TaxID=861298 RepID=A0A1G8CEY8_9VIBR|nr:hypothetical protein [Vibrio xiamenensis]SDH44054.1 hypothetical protein SAMN04488136_11633 [Vibrio xiamenensis]
MQKLTLETQNLISASGLFLYEQFPMEIAQQDNSEPKLDWIDGHKTEQFESELNEVVLNLIESAHSLINEAVKEQSVITTQTTYWTICPNSVPKDAFSVGQLYFSKDDMLKDLPAEALIFNEEDFEKQLNSNKFDFDSYYVGLNFVHESEPLSKLLAEWIGLTIKSGDIELLSCASDKDVWYDESFENDEVQSSAQRETRAVRDCVNRVGTQLKSLLAIAK